MKAFVYVSLKKTVLDPQGKYFELTLDGGLDKAAAEAEVERIAREVLTNPVIEEFSYKIED